MVEQIIPADRTLRRTITAPRSRRIDAACRGNLGASRKLTIPQCSPERARVSVRAPQHRRSHPVPDGTDMHGPLRSVCNVSVRLSHRVAEAFEDPCNQATPTGLGEPLLTQRRRPTILGITPRAFARLKY